MLSAATIFFKRNITQFMGQSVMNRVLKSSAKASVWVGVELGSRSVLRLISNFIMARLLAPEAFGLIGIAFTVQYAIMMLTDIGLNGSVIRSERGAERSYLRTIWVTQIVRNALVTAAVLIFCLVLYLNQAKVPDTSIWAMPIAPWFIGVAALSGLIQGFESPSLLYAQRTLDLKRVTIMKVGMRFINIPVMVGLAILGFGPWSLLLGILVSDVLRLILSHTWIKGPRMAFEWDRQAFHEIFHFGKWLLIASFATFVIARGDQLIFSSLFDSRTFSLFVVAGIWIKVANDMIRMLIRKICFPAIAETRRENPKQVPQIYKRFRVLADALAIAAFCVLVFGNDIIFSLFYNDTMEPAKVFVPFLAFSLLFAPHILINQVVLAAGDSRMYMFLKATTAIVLVVGLPLIYNNFGMMPAVAAAGLIGVINMPLILYALSKHMKLSLVTEGRIVVAGVLAGAYLFMTM